MVEYVNEQYVKLVTFLTGDHEKEEGQGLVEYALIIVLVSIACTALLGALGTGIGGVFSTITSSL